MRPGQRSRADPSPWSAETPLSGSLSLWGGSCCVTRQQRAGRARWTHTMLLRWYYVHAWYHGMSRTGLPAASCLWLAHSPASLQNVRPAASLHCQRASLALLSRPARSLYTQHVVAPNVPFSIIPFASHASPVSTRRCKQLGTRLTTRQGAAGLAALRPVHAARMARDASWAPP